MPNQPGMETEMNRGTQVIAETVLQPDGEMVRVKRVVETDLNDQQHERSIEITGEFDVTRLRLEVEEGTVINLPPHRRLVGNTIICETDEHE